MNTIYSLFRAATIACFLLFSFSFLQAQITTNPAKPKFNEPLEIVFDAGKGNKALYGFKGDVYYHAGLITSNSTSSSDWKYVRGDWGKADANFKLKNLGGDKYQLNLNLWEKFKVGTDIKVFQLALVFRDAKGEIVAKTDNETDFLVPLDGYMPPVKDEDTLKYKERGFVRYELKDDVLHLTTTHGTYCFQYYSTEILKVSFLPENKPLHDTSISVIAQPQSLVAEIDESASFIKWQNGSFMLQIHKNPLHIKYFYADSLLLSEEMGFFERNENVGVRYNLSPDEAIYGTGERAVPMNRRGFRLELYNRPDYNYGLNARNLNYSLPVMLSNRKYLLFIDNPQKGYLDIGEKEENVLEFGAIGGEMKYFVVGGKTFDDISKSFAGLVGKQPLPPLWALGNLQSRMAYRTQAEVESIAAEMLKKDFPMDAIIIDFYWFGDSILGYLGQLKWFEKNWPNPQAMISNLKSKGIKTILITEPFVVDTSYWFTHGDTSQLFATRKEGKTYILQDFYFGRAALMDMFKPATKDWFWEQYKKQIDIGVAGWWGDLGEPETHAQDMYHVNGKAFEVHNMYAHEWAGMLYKKYAEFYPNERLFHLNRSGSVGTQRYSIFPWSGDVSRSWSGFQAQLPLMLNMSLCGLGYISSDLGGFAAGEKDEELYTRWLQMGVFNPVFRPHGSGIPSEPIFFSEETQRIVRNSIKLRYRLMPYIYNAAAENSMTGRPIVKPLFYYHPDDARFTEYSEAYYFGDQMVVVPVIQRKATGKEIKLPEGMWYDFYTREMVEGPATINKELTMENIPVFVKAGSFIPMVNDFQTTDNYPHQNLQIHFYPQKMGESAQYSLFDDDGKDAKNLKTGNYRITNFESNHSDEELTINIKTQNNHYKAPRNEFLEWHIYALDKFPAALEVDGEKIPVFHILNKPAIMGIDAKYNPTNKELIIIMPRTQETMSMKIIK